jgi:mono/diheme cytochrome c family protein
VNRVWAGVSGTMLLVGVVALAAAAPAAKVPAAPAVPAAAQVGAGTLYDRYCLACHGVDGDGAGPAAPWLFPKPRDLVKAQYRWRSTGSGQPPTDDDLVRVIKEGAPGTSMPAFGGILSDAQIGELVVTVKAFAPKKFAKPGTAIKVPATPADLAALSPRGAELFVKAGCVQCHGAGGAGDGPSAATLKDEKGRLAPPHDLTTRPLKRGQRGALDVYLTLATGLDGANMPAFAGALPEADLWALTAHVEAIRWKGEWKPGARAIDPRGAEKVVPGLSIDAQGVPPESLPPAAASLSSQQCGRCHARQLREWQGSLHARTASPGTMGQLVNAKPAFVAGCQRCHMPLAEQLPGAAGFDADLRSEGVTCAGCHVRGWTRRGPPRAGDSRLLEDPSYPFVVDAAYERSDLCLPCHQLPPTELVEGRPLLDTYREWLEGPYMARGIQCQHCHMPERKHAWKGAHDAATVKQGVKLQATAQRAGGRVKVTVSIENVGAGHYLPTTPTPAGYLDVELLDASGKPVASWTQRIGRHLEYKEGWKQIEDTRIPPGGKLELAPVLEDAKKAARSVRFTLRWVPDDYYEGFYQRLLKGKLSDEARKLLEDALAQTRRSKFVVWKKEITLK